ncbi:glycosyltransferase [Pedobacter sp. MC2016-05]|uniref:glycosyltransferase n=1 Tax=Pedobacter sp. MC2016-05 TaxID=2994474 RepID=UPI002245193C|nr:glycosyltransferase [Pedobacter sp. MC2016-05]MCX2473232.1 glycosyltransferase [Pedobacter sp. MC2016-05]
MKILILWSGLSDYAISCYRELSLRSGVELHLVYQPVKSSAPFDPFDLTFCKSAKIDNNKEKKQLIADCVALKPDAILMASWNYNHYMEISKLCKANGTYVLSTFDGQWLGTIKQRIGIATSKIFLKPRIDNFMVPGDRQSHFARLLGYNNPLNGLYCANTSRFKDFPKNRPKKFLFIGRLVEIKGVKELLEAYSIYRKSCSNPWNLIVAGVGPLKEAFVDQEGVELRGFVQPSELSSLFYEASCFVLPSLKEPWGLVVHEAAIAGSVIICSHKVGASTWFVRDGQNGHLINPDVLSILSALKRVSKLSSEKIEEMGVISKSLGELWTIEKWADYVLDNLSIQGSNV